MRVIPTVIPEFAALGLPPQLKEIAQLRDGIVLVTGPRGSGKSSTLAALLDCINEQQICHIITIEDPIEFLHLHKRATIHQRELHSDAPSFPLALRAALRQAPKVIFVGELRDRETIEMVIEAAETGHLVFSALNSIDIAKTLDRLVGTFSPAEHKTIRTRLAKTLRYSLAQRLLPRKDGSGRVMAMEIFKATSRTSTFIECSDESGHSLLQATRSRTDGMQSFDGEIEKLVRAGTVDAELAAHYASDPLEMRQKLGL